MSDKFGYRRADGRIDLGEMTFGEFTKLQQREERERDERANAEFGNAVMANLNVPQPRAGDDGRMRVQNRVPSVMSPSAPLAAGTPRSVTREVAERNGYNLNRPLGEADFEKAQGIHGGRQGRELTPGGFSPLDQFESAQGHHGYRLPRRSVATEEFRDAIAHRETDGVPGVGYGAKHVKGRALGRYQLTPAALKQIGWMKPDGSWSAEGPNLNGSQVGGRSQRISSDSEFLRNPEAQERAMAAYLRDNMRQLQVLGALKRVGRQIDGKLARFTITAGGLAAAAHRQGPGAVMRYLAFQESGGWQSNAALLSQDDRKLFQSVETRLREFEKIPVDSDDP